MLTGTAAAGAAVFFLVTWTGRGVQRGALLLRAAGPGNRGGAPASSPFPPFPGKYTPLADCMEAAVGIQP